MKIPHHVADHTLILLRNGEDYFPHLIESIDRAARFIYLETYIFEADEAGRAVTDALKKATGRGVKVYLMLDGFGSLELPQAWERELLESGVRVMWYRKGLGWLNLRRSHLRRLHRKLVVVDGSVAFVGGINIIRDHPDDIPAPRLDYAVQINGPVAGRILLAMQQLWKRVAWSRLHERGRHIKPHLLAPDSHPEIRFVVRDNLRHRRDIEHAYLGAIREARQEIILANAYFLPGRQFRRTLLRRAREGVRVILLLQGRVEYRLQHYATQALYDELLEAGVEIHEYLASYLHAKVAVIDGKWATVGSSNIDPFSLWLAREANLVIQDKSVAADLREDLLQQIAQHGHRIVRSGWQKKGWVTWLMTHASYALVRMLTGLIGPERGQDDI